MSYRYCISLRRGTLQSDLILDESCENVYYKIIIDFSEYLLYNNSVTCVIRYPVDLKPLLQVRYIMITYG